jgi:hypothetical protein
VGDSLAIESVGGSDACKKVVVDGHASIADLIVSSTGRQQLAKEFNFCDPTTALSTEEVGVYLCLSERMLLANLL